MLFSKKKKAEIKKKTKSQIFLEYLQKLFFWILGTFIVAIALEMFLLPNKIIDGGVIGISMMVSYVTKYNLGLLIFCINIPFLLLALKSLGKKFVDKVLAPALTESAKNITKDMLNSLAKDLTKKMNGSSKSKAGMTMEELRSEVQRLTLEQQYKKLKNEG